MTQQDPEKSADVSMEMAKEDPPQEPISDPQPLEDDSLLKYEEDIKKRFEIPEEPAPEDPQELIEYLERRMKLLEVCYFP